MNQTGPPDAGHAPLAAPAGGGGMGERIRAFDWSKSPLGPAASWSPALQTAVRLMLANRLPMLLWWGPQYVSIYNDPYSPVLGNKHPWALGQPVSECWKEIWHVLRPLIDTPFHGGPATWDEDILLVINRQGFVEETHWLIAYSPVPDDSVAGGIGGVLATVHETTEKVLGERRMVALRDLATRPAEAKAAGEACAVAARTLGACARDIPFALLYLTDEVGRHARLAATAGIAGCHGIGPELVDLDGDGGNGWPLSDVKRTMQAQVVADLGARFAAVPPGPWPDPPAAAVVLPLRSGTAHAPAGFLVAGVSSRLRLDDTYRGFLDLVAGQVAVAVANARAREEERRRAEALAELDRAKTAFFSNVSHEFRTPLTLMLGPIEELLARGHTDLTPAAVAQLEAVNRNGLRLLRLVNTLLDFSRIEAGRVRASFQPTDLAAFTTDLASNFRAACERAGLRFVVDCPALGESVHVDREMWEKVVLNLLSNAFKFTFEGAIAVSLRRAGSVAELRVADTGTGIPAGEMSRLFERFHRVEGARGRTHEGSGIGLALVQELVKLHGGTIAAERAVGAGTTFTVAVPFGAAHLPPEQIGAARSPAPTGVGASPYVEEALRWLPDYSAGDVYAERSAPHEPLPTPHHPPRPDGADDRPRVLVADDNADMRQYVARLLVEQFRVEAVSDGEAALAAARRQRPDLILSDVMMPRLDGLGLLRAVRADVRLNEVPVILLSARAGEESRVEGVRAGADDYLVKPFSARELLARVAAHLQMARLRWEANETLRASEERFRTLFDSMDQGFCVIEVTFDPAGRPADFRFVELNPAFERQSGLRGVLGRSVREVVPGLEEFWFDTYARVAATGEPTRFVHQAVALDRWFEVSSFRLRDAGRNRVAVLFTDITDRLRASEALREADRRKDEFLATLAHELRNPLAPLRNGLQVMKLAGGDGRVVERSRAMMERQVDQMAHLIDDLMDVSRISRGKVVLQKTRMRLAAALGDAIETSRPLIERHGHEFVLTVPDEPIFVDGDGTRLTQVFANLLNNAAKYTEPGGRIRLVVERQGGDVVVSVEDTGVGIPAHMLPKVFDLFSQVDRSLEKSQGGLGIGLSIVKKLVEMHGGTITAESGGYGTGSRFTVRLPVALSVTAGPSDDRGERAAPAARRRILVVDDNMDGATSLAEMLAIMGNETQTAHDGSEAVAAAEAFRPDVILLDIGMPKLNGYDACRRIRQQPWGKNIVIVAQTGWGQEDDKAKSQEAGFDLHMVKPVDPAALQRLLAEPRAAIG